MTTDERVRQHVALAVSDCRYERIDGVKQYATGERHAVFQVSYAGDGGTRTVVVRVGAADEARDCERAELEAVVLRAMRGRGAPLLIDFRCASAWLDAPTMCMSHIPGPSKSFDALSDGEAEALGATVAGVHAFDVPELEAVLGGQLPLPDYLTRRFDDDVTRRMPAPAGPVPDWLYDRLRTAYLSVLDRVGDGEHDTSAFAGGSLVLLHGDVCAANVIWSPRPVLIDWEDARLGDPAEEVAYAFAENDLPVPRRQAFWRGYRVVAGDAVSAAVRARIECWEPITLLGAALWWIQRYAWRSVADREGRADRSTPRPAEHYLTQGTERLERFEQQDRWSST